MYLDVQFIFIEIEKVLNDVFIEAEKINNIVECTKIIHSVTTHAMHSRVKRIVLPNKNRMTNTILEILIFRKI